ncbi:hypothetical protein B0T10DRAFT_130882 [Thelonectria olida]|uniref:Zn(2)-C6 fungal-type domain-containing protein n=1 Tax=Thelonectria olida TaxID=1576542 RepID=A0A9P8VY66_9HYPO|nr:hypothetical protein B0T10DRAFT_130882 [Thelonectria olida]
MSDEDGGPASRKRRVIPPPYAKRKRASTACQFCRQRKTKCDNVRPVCGFCRYHRARCIYEDESSVDDKVPYDEASQEIIERLDEIKELLKQQGNAPRDPVALPPLAAIPEIHATPLSIVSDQVTSLGDEQSLAVRLPFATLRCESLLRWPVFNGVIPEKYSSIMSFLLESVSQSHSVTQPLSDENGRGSRRGPGIREEDLVPLCRKFLKHVHPRNPILEPEELIKSARVASEHGLGWDSTSCLILLACALAHFTVPWRIPPESPGGIQDIVFLEDVSDEAKVTAESYYMAAKKRIGLLGTSVPDVQCFFLASVYEKYALRPLQAWFCIQQASTRLQAHLLGSGQQLWNSAKLRNTHTHHLEQRVFWSCFKAESELAPELGLQTSDLRQFGNPCLFPSPPETLSIDQAHHAEDGFLADHSEAEERGWFFYLAEISLRRTINDALDLLYRKDEKHWMNNIKLLVSQHEEQERQVLLWHSSLPTPIQFPDTKPAEHELSFYLQGRFLEWRLYLLRPFIYYALHNPLDPATGPQVIALAQKGMSVCAEMIPRYMYHHRHGGTWFVMRHLWTCAVLVLAAVAHKGDVLPPENWRHLADMALTALDRWASQAADIQHMLIVLRELYQAILVRADQNLV